MEPAFLVIGFGILTLLGLILGVLLGISSSLGTIIGLLRSRNAFLKGYVDEVNSHL